MDGVARTDSEAPMRRLLKLMAIAVWLGVHAWMWTSLPPLPELVFHRSSSTYATFLGEGSFIALHRFDGGSPIEVYDMADGHKVREWPHSTEAINFTGVVAGSKGWHLLWAGRQSEHP